MAGADVLDVVCSTGHVTHVLAAAAAVGWGIDVSRGTERRARRDAARDRRETADFARMNAADRQFEDGAFEGGVCRWALHLVADGPTTATSFPAPVERRPVAVTVSAAIPRGPP